jgi:hypothetical protein
MQSRCCCPPDIPSADSLSRSFTSSHSAAARRLRQRPGEGGGVQDQSPARAARERHNQARLKITSSQRQIMRDAVRAWYDLVSIRAVRTVTKTQALTVLRAFEGLRKEMLDPKLHRSITDLLGLRQVYLATQTALMDSNRNEAVSVFKLLAAMGRLNATDLKLPVEIYDPAVNLKHQASRIVGDGIQGD